MRTWSIPVVLATLACAGLARADEHEEMRAALHELKIVQRHLKDAPQTYAGHRAAALKAVSLALQEVRMALGQVRREKDAAGGAD